MSFFLSFILFALAGAFYLARAGQIAMLNGLCGYGPSLCQNPQWVLYAAGAMLALALVFNIDKI